MMGFATPDKPMADQPTAIAVLTRDNDTLRAQLAAANAELAEWRSLHNGYDPECRAAMPDLKEPRSPKDAMNQLVGEAVALAVAGANEKLAGVEAWRQGLLGFAGCLRMLGDPKLGQMVISEHVVKHAADLERVIGNV